MSDDAPSNQFANAAPDAPQQSLTPERIERVLGDFRDWLGRLSEPETPATPVENPVDLHTLVGQFTGLRQEVNLQTKATRTAVEQNAATLEQYRSAMGQLEETLDDLRASQESAASSQAGEAIKPMLKGIIDVYDALAIALRQVTRQRETVRHALQDVEESFTIEPPPSIDGFSPAVRPKRGFWSRLFGGTTPSTSPVEQDRSLDEWYERITEESNLRQEKVKTTAAFFRQSIEGLITGYSMSLSRIERLLPLLDLEPMVCLGHSFDPEIMEVVEVVLDGGHPSGEVIEEVRRGYRRLGQIYRYAQVRVAK